MDPISQLRAQWSSPSDVTTVLMVIGGDIVAAALAQSTGTLFTPVCFSFGWVSYAFMALIGVMGDGRLLPPPDYPAKVFNLDSGYARENKNWVLGRILRDHESSIAKKVQWDEGIRISIFEAEKNQNCWTRFSYNRLHAFGLASMILQLIIAALPMILYDNWLIMLITGGGTLLALTYGLLPQWTAEKLPNRQHANYTFALTTGNGSKDIMIIKGMGRCLNVEEFAVTDTPRNGRPWEKFSKVFAKPRGSREDLGDSKFREGDENLQKSHFIIPLSRTQSILRDAQTLWGLPVGFWITIVITVIQSILWLVLLITVAAVKNNTWYLLAVGAIGMFQNGVIAAINMPPEARNLPLKLVETITTKKVMDGLMDLEMALKSEASGSGGFAPPDDAWKGARCLVKEFFPGALRKDEQDWWDGKRKDYEFERLKQVRSRGIPRGLQLENLGTKSTSKQPPGASMKREDLTSPSSSNVSVKVTLQSPRAKRDSHVSWKESTPVKDFV